MSTHPSERLNAPLQRTAFHRHDDLCAPSSRITPRQLRPRFDLHHQAPRFRLDSRTREQMRADASCGGAAF
jgi:hypothetical protein